MNCRFLGNLSTIAIAGGLYLDGGSTTTIADSGLDGLSAHSIGGGVFIAGPGAGLLNCTFVANVLETGILSRKHGTAIERRAPLRFHR